MRALRSVALLVAAVLLLAACGPGEDAPLPAPETAPDLATAAARFTDLQHGPDEGYEVPPEQAREDLAAAVLAEGEGRPQVAAPLLAAHGYRAVDGPDGTRLLLPERLPDPRGWGAVAVQPEGRPLVVEVPHPRSDLDTDRVGGALAAATQARYLLLAGARRSLADDAADPSRNEDTLLHALHVALAAEGLPALQLHGYAEASLPGEDVVVSPGATEVSVLARAVAAATDDLGLVTCRAWERACGRLEGRRNVQGRASAELEVPFVHLELTRAVRAEQASRAALVEALADALTGR